MGGAPLPEGIELMKDGIRCDGRKPEDLRPIKIEAGVLNRADGSAYVELGGSHVMAAVYGPRELHPKHLSLPDRAVLKTRYNMIPFSVGDRKRPGPDRRSVEISKVTRECLEPVLYLEDYPKSGIDLNIDILQADAGTRVTGIIAASVALADAGLEMKSLVAACAAGKVADTIVLDLNGPEDNFGDADVPLAMNMTTGELTLLQMDGLLSEQELELALKMGMDGCRKIYEAQRDALKRRYQ